MEEVDTFNEVADELRERIKELDPDSPLLDLIEQAKKKHHEQAELIKALADHTKAMWANTAAMRDLDAGDSSNAVEHESEVLVRILSKTTTRPQWTRPAYNEATEQLRRDGYSSWAEFLSSDGDTHVVEFTRDGSRGKDRVLILIERHKELKVDG